MGKLQDSGVYGRSRSAATWPPELSYNLNCTRAKCFMHAPRNAGGPSDLRWPGIISAAWRGAWQSVARLWIFTGSTGASLRQPERRGSQLCRASSTNHAQCHARHITGAVP